MSLTPQQCVLIIDHSAESREVLRTVLARADRQIWESPAAAEGLELARRHRPQLIVLDVETQDADRAGLIGGLGQAAKDSGARLVVLASALRQTTELPCGEFVAKPYHYGPLIRRIEDLLGEIA